MQKAGRQTHLGLRRRQPLPNATVREARHRDLPLVVSLFSGAGGLDLGFKNAGFHVAVAFDSSAAAIRTHKRNFPETESVVADLAAIKAQGVLACVEKHVPRGSRIGVIGGPPCQGFSRANTLSHANDPRNAYPALYLEIVRKLQRVFKVEFVVFENVLGIRDKKHVATYETLVNGLAATGFDVAAEELCALDFGVPQNRRRVLVCGMRKGQGYSNVKTRGCAGKRTVAEAIGLLAPPAFFSHGLDPSKFPEHPNHWTMQPKSPRFRRPDTISADGRSFKRLRWDDPSPTIAFGHREIHVHPSGTRRLSVFEALRLQGFPDQFVLEGNLSQQVEQVSNAVPPPVARSVARAVKRALGVK